MAGEIPDGLAIESTWAVEATYGPDAAQRRPAVRQEHLKRIGELRAVREEPRHRDAAEDAALGQAVDHGSRRPPGAADSSPAGDRAAGHGSLHWRSRCCR